MPNIDQVQLPDGSQYNLKDNISGYVTAGYVDDAIDALTKANVGLGNVDNTSDLNKPVSTAQQTALNGKTDTTVIAPTEATTTASRKYEIGEQFILNGVLYTATAVIASGDTIIANTNCELSESITEQIANVDLSALANKSDLTSIFESGTTASQAISAGTYFYLNGTLVRARTAIASGATFTLNTNYEIVPALNRLRDVELNTGGVRGRNSSATSHTINGWSTFFCAIIVGFMDNVGGFIGSITGTTYTHIAGTNMTQNNRLTLSLSGSTLTLNGASTFTFTFIMH